jgi:hypothetical protein
MNARFQMIAKVIRDIENNAKVRDHNKVHVAVNAYLEFITSAKVRLTGFNSSPADIQALFARERSLLEAWAFAERQNKAAAQKLFQAKRGNGGKWGR